MKKWTNILRIILQNRWNALQNSKKNQEKLLRNAVYGNLKLMKKTLNEKQYADMPRVLKRHTAEQRYRSEINFASDKYENSI